MNCLKEVKTVKVDFSAIRHAVDRCIRVSVCNTDIIPRSNKDLLRIEMSAKTLQKVKDDAIANEGLPRSTDLKSSLYDVDVVINDNLQFGEFNILEVV